MKGEGVMKEGAINFALMFAFIAASGGAFIGWGFLGVWLIPFFKSLGEPFGAGCFVFFMSVAPVAAGCGVAFALSDEG
jgi:hypothetical protein